MEEVAGSLPSYSSPAVRATAATYASAAKEQAYTATPGHTAVAAAARVQKLGASNTVFPLPPCLD